MKFAIGEKINSIYSEFIVALPDNNDEYIKVSVNPVLCIDGTVYYSDNMAETFDAHAKMMSALTPEWAEKHIPGCRRGMKLLTVSAFCEYYCKADTGKVNERLRNKLSRLTRWEFYNTKW